MKISVFGDSIIGMQRDHNEDSYLIICDTDKQWKKINDQQIDLTGSRGLIFAVADGMGGTNAGEVASAIAVETLSKRIETINESINRPEQAHKILSSIAHAIHNNIIKEAKKKKETKGMGTTIVLGWILNNNLYILWIGDSRCYHYNKSKHSQLTPFSDDHSLVWSRVKNGEITAEEARLSSESNLLLQSLGDTYNSPHPEFKWIKLENNDRILLCSDGLNSMLSTVGIQQILDFSDSTKDTCQSLINAANNAGGHDNITAILIDIIEIDLTSRPSIIKITPIKRWFGGLVAFLVLTIIAAFLYFADRKLNYATDVKKFFLSITKEKTKNPNINIDSSFSSVQDDTMNILSPDTSNTMLKKDSDKLSINNNTVKSYSRATWTQESKIQSLQNALDRMQNIELKIEPILPNKAEYKPEFYSIHSKSLASVQHKLDSLKIYIKGYAEMQDNKIIRLKDSSIKERNISSILLTVDSLNTVTEDILSSQE